MTLRLQDTPKRGKGSPERTWAYGAYAEIDPKAVSDPRKQLADMDIISCLFSGCSVPPGATTRIDLHFTPHHEAGERMISDSNVIPGDYVLKVIGFNEKGKQVFRTEGIPYPLAANTLLACFKNGQWTYYPNMDRNIWASLSRLKPRSRCIAAVAGVVNILQRERCLNPCEYEHIQGLDLLDALQGQPVKSCKVRCHCVASFSRSVRQSKS